MMEYYAHGKLLLTGEYLVLKGAEALALPLKFGQKLKVQKTGKNELHWQSLNHKNEIWFEGTFDFTKKSWSNVSDPQIAAQLEKLLNACSSIANNARLFAGLRMTCSLEFNPKWGWGSSSTLIDLLAQFSNVNVFELSAQSFGGSGYDVACARASGPILYNNIEHSSRRIEITWPFKDQLLFVYSGNKMNSRKAMKKFDQSKNYVTEINKLRRINEQILNIDNIADFSSLILDHENMISNILDQVTLGSQLKNFDGVIKSLGAWGGDFFLAISENMKMDEMKKFFKSHGHQTMFGYQEIILE